VGIFQTDASGACVHVDERWCELSGLSAERARGEGWADAVHPDDLQSVWAAWVEGVRSRKPFRREVRYLRPDGSERWVLAHALPVIEGERVTGYVGTVTDIGDLKAREVALRQRKELAERVIGCSVDGILAFDRECRYTVWNPAMETISGFTAEEVLGRSAFEVFPFLEEIGEDRFFHAALAGERLVAEDRPYRIPTTGRQGFFEGHYAPIRDGEGEVVGGLAVIRDITAQKEALEALRMAQQQVVHTSKLAAMGELGAGIAHELNQPLAGIKMIVSLMQRHPERSVGDYAEELRLVREQVDRMASIVDNMRGFARKSDFAPEAIGAREPVDGALTLMGEQLRLAEVEVVQEGPPVLPSVLADRVRLQQVFLNLLTNALQAVEAGAVSAPRITLAARGVDDFVEYEVSDNGPGVPADVAARIFDPFFTTKPAGVGTGLGLSLVLTIVREHGGSVRHETPAQGGARFVVRVPAAASPPERPSPASADPGPGAWGDARPRVLVVDDEEVVRDSVRHGLEALGCEPEVWASGEEALEAVARASFDLALVDLRMPGMGGLELCARLRGDQPSLRVAVMSGFLSEAAREELAGLGVDVVLDKPFDLADLRRVVGAALEDTLQR
jgi:PAS domain S-box-containing protein